MDDLASPAVDQIVADDTVLATWYDLNPVDGANGEATVEDLQDAWRRIIGSGKAVVVLQDAPRTDQQVLDYVSQQVVSASRGCAAPEDKAFPARETKQK